MSPASKIIGWQIQSLILTGSSCDQGGRSESSGGESCEKEICVWDT